MGTMSATPTFCLLILCSIIHPFVSQTVVTPDVDRMNRECCNQGMQSPVCLPEDYPNVPSLNNDWNMYCKSHWIQCCVKQLEVRACGKGADVARQGGDCGLTPVDERDPHKNVAIACCTACQAGRTSAPSCSASGTNGLVDQTFALCCQQAATKQPQLPEPEAQSSMAAMEPPRDETVASNDPATDKKEVAHVEGQASGVVAVDEVRGDDESVDGKPAHVAETPDGHEPAEPITCPPNQVMNAITKTCVDSACEETSCPAHHTCTVMDGSIRCDMGCQPGFLLTNKTCVDVNECADEGNECQTSGMDCLNTDGAYECLERRLDRGEELMPQESEPATTELTVGDEPPVDCPDGQTLIGGQCEEDVDNCASGRHMCMTYQKCIKEGNSHRCEDIKCEDGMKVGENGTCISVECPTGFEHNSFRDECVDIDECQRNATACNDDQICKNTDGSFECQKNDCKPGFRMEKGWWGSECKDIDECEEPNGHNCTELQECKNKEGGFECECKRGYQRNNETNLCEDVDECLTPAHNCNQSTSTCNNTIGSYDCVCHEGFERTSMGGCSDIDECLSAPCKGNGRCHNKLGGFECRCNSGYFLEGNTTCVHDGRKRECFGLKQSNGTCYCPDGFTAHDYGDRIDCLDIDECDPESPKNKCPSNELCINTHGNHSCIDVSCPENYFSVESNTDRKIWCRHQELSERCLDSNEDCVKRFKGPATISYNYVTLYPGMEGLPKMLYTMKNLPVNDTECEVKMMKVHSSKSYRTVDFSRDFRTNFDHDNGVCTIELMKPLFDESHIELQVDVRSRLLPEGKRLIHTSRLMVFVSKYNEKFGNDDDRRTGSDDIR